MNRGTRVNRRRLPRSRPAVLATAMALAVAAAVAVSVSDLGAHATAATHATAAGRATHTTAAAHANPEDAAGRSASNPAGATQPPADPNPFAPGSVLSAPVDESDPVLYRIAGRYFLFTSGIPGLPTINVPVTSTTDFDTWSPVAEALPALPAWAVPGYTWAPDLHRFGSTYVLYFTAMARGTQPPMECIGDAVGSEPGGPFRALDTPIICQWGQGGSIDPRVFTGPGGTDWMLWKSDQNINGSTTPTQMWSQPLTADGLALTGEPSLLMGPDELWQGSIVEAPDMVEVGHTFWLFYSGNWFNQAGYAIGVALCQGPAGPCADSSPLPLLGSNAQGAGPGEESVFEDGGGVWMLYSPTHSSVPLPQIPPRPVMITRIGFGPHGPYLAAGPAPPSLAALGGASLWSAP